MFTLFPHVLSYATQHPAVSNMEHGGLGTVCICLHAFNAMLQEWKVYDNVVRRKENIRASVNEKKIRIDHLRSS